MAVESSVGLPDCRLTFLVTTGNVTETKYADFYKIVWRLSGPHNCMLHLLLGTDEVSEDDGRLLLPCMMNVIA